MEGTEENDKQAEDISLAVKRLSHTNWHFTAVAASLFFFHFLFFGLASFAK